MTRLYCLVEDRKTEEIGLRFAIASLLRACDTARVVVHRPNPTTDFRKWISRHSRVTFIPELPPTASSWNCKPHVMLPHLEGSVDEVIWLDSDIIVNRDPSYLFDRLGPNELVGTEEPLVSPNQGWANRALGWGLEPGRDSRVTLNSCVVRATKAHIPLLLRWKELLANSTYLSYQRRPISERPFYMHGDQDVLNALLGSKEFVHLPVRLLRGGVDVIQCGGALGYSLRQRLAGLPRRCPPFLHAIGTKPWLVFLPAYTAQHSKWFTFYRRLLQETSPYLTVARRLRREVGMDCEWLDARTWLGLTLRLVGFKHFALCGLPLTLAAMGISTVKRMVRGSGWRGSLENSR